MPNVALIIGVPILVGWTSNSWCAEHIDGSSQSSFERSVALLQNSLAPRQREEFQLALGTIWLKNTVGQIADLDHDGDVDVEDFRASIKIASDILVEIQRGEVLSALEKREGKYGPFTVADYIEQLNGLGYDEVLSLARQPSRSVAIEPQQTSPLVGIWYGVLPPPHRHETRELRMLHEQTLPLLMEVTIATDGTYSTYSGRVRSIQQGTVLPLKDITVDGTTARWRQPSVTGWGSYEGKLTDGTTLVGTWSQAGSKPLDVDAVARTVIRLPLVFHKLQFP